MCECDICFPKGPPPVSIEADVGWHARIARDFAAPRGYVLGRRLGEGSSAKTYEVTNTVVPNTLVVKVTTDKGDAKASLRAMEAQRRGLARHLVQTYGVWRIDGEERAFVMLVERLQRLTTGQAEAYDEYGIRLGSLTANEQVEMPHRPELWPMAAALNIREIKRSFMEIGASYYGDFHSGNIMNRPGEGVVVCDLGLTSMAA